VIIQRHKIVAWSATIIVVTDSTGGHRMQKADKIDYAKLLGFEVMGDQSSASVDFQDETFAARLGAKVGTEAMCPLLDAPQH
jgi:hypothetical protein